MGGARAATRTVCHPTPPPPQPRPLQQLSSEVAVRGGKEARDDGEDLGEEVRGAEALPDLQTWLATRSEAAGETGRHRQGGALPLLCPSATPSLTFSTTPSAWGGAPCFSSASPISRRSLPWRTGLGMTLASAMAEVTVGVGRTGLLAAP